VAERIAQEGGVAHVLSSDLPRARMTAEAIVRATSVPLELSPLLQERNFGALRGRPYAELGVDPFAADFVPPEGESWPAFHARVAQAFAQLLERRRSLSGTLVVVSHGLVFRALAERHLSCVGHAVPARFDNTSVSLFELEAPHRVHLLNCTAHLALAAPLAQGPV
jgi:probable phosphoglycerate mutase